MKYSMKILQSNYSKIVIGTICVLLSLIILLGKSFRVVSFSMAPAYLVDDIVLAESLSLKFFDLERGEVMVYKDPRQTEHPYVIKRIIGMPGEKLVIENDIVSIVDQNMATTTFPKDSLLGRKENGSDYSVNLGPADYFLMGDNRPGSKDSRVSGTIQPHEIYGRPFFRIYPFHRFGFVE
jgi:signal peptidase I